MENLDRLAEEFKNEKFDTTDIESAKRVIYQVQQLVATYSPEDEIPERELQLSLLLEDITSR